MLAPLDNEIFFKKAFTDKIVFKQFVKDIFGVDVNVGKIETEKQFKPKIGNIDIKLDIYAETTDKRFIIEIQRMDYDYNFDRFLHYFISVIIEQQKNAKEYKMKQDVLAIVVLTQPYSATTKMGMPIQDNMLKLDFDFQNYKKEKIKIWGHNLVILNPHPKYKDIDTPKKYNDWLDLFRLSTQTSKMNNITYTLNYNNTGIARAVKLADYNNMSPQEMHEAKKQEGRKIVLTALNNNLEQAKKKLDQKDKELEQKDQALEQKDQALEQKDQALEQKDQALEQKDQALIESAKTMLKSGIDIERVAEITKLSTKQIQYLVKL